MRRQRRFAALLAVCLAAPTPGRAQGPAPIPWQEQGPAGRLFLQLPLEAPEPLAPGAASVDLRLIYANTMVVAQGARARVDVDLESALTTVAVRTGVAPGLELTVAVPIISDAGGVFDGLIEGVERAFASENFQRAGRQRGLVRYELGPASGGGLSRTGAASDLGDLWASAKWLAWGGAGWRPTVALRAAAKAPTGGPTFGSGTWDLGGGLLAAWAWPGGALRLSVDGIAPTGRLARAGLDTRPYGAAQAGLALQLTSWLSGQAQLSAHLSPLHRTGIGQLDLPIYDAVLGFTVALAPQAELLLAGVENFASPRRGADAAFLVALRFTAQGDADDEAARRQQPGGGASSAPVASLAAAPSRGR